MAVIDSGVEHAPRSAFNLDAWILVAAIAASMGTGVPIFLGLSDLFLPENFLAPLLGIIFVYKITLTRNVKLLRHPMFLSMLVWLVLLAYSTYSSPYHPYPAFAHYVVPLAYFSYFYLSDLDERAFVTIMFAAGTTMAVLALVAYAHAQLIGSDEFLVTSAADYGMRVKLTTKEPNIFAANLGVFAVFRVGYDFLKKRLSLQSLLMFAAIFLGFSKGPLLAVLIAIGLFYLLAARSYSNGAFYGTLLMIALVLVGLLFSDKIADAWDRFFAHDDAVNSRMTYLHVFWKQFPHNPWFGLGPMTYQEYGSNYAYLYGLSSQNLANGINGTPAWLDMEIPMVMNDAGLVGLFFFVIWHVTVYSSSYRAFRWARSGRSLGLFCAGFSLLLSSQVTTQHTVAFYGLILGLIARESLRDRGLGAS